MIGQLARMLRDKRGTVVIETAIVAPVLILLAIGAFEASRMVSRQFELQYSIDEAAQIALAAAPGSADEQATVEDVIEASTGLADANVELAAKFRCGTTATMVDDPASCGATPYASFLRITLSDTYTPIWTQIAFGSPVTYSVVRTVQIG